MKTQQLLDYTTPVLKKNNTYGEFIEYQVFSFEKLKYERYRIRLHKISQQHATRRDYLKCVNRMMIQLSQRLSDGWTPTGDVANTRMFLPVRVALEAYMEDKKRDFRESSYESYTSVLRILKNWLKEKGLANLEIRIFSANLAIEFMESLRDRPKFNNNTYNTYLHKYRAAWNWLIEHGYCMTNPFNKCRNRPTETKIRTLIPPNTRYKVLAHVRNSKAPNFEIVMHLIFSSLIRPTEIMRIQLKDINLKDACIHISADKAKTHKDRYAVLTDACIKQLIPLLSKGYPNDWYLLGKDLVPSPEKCWNGRFKKEWMKIRKACHLPVEMQLYSLKDSGITELLESGLDTLTVMKAADHHDLTTTTKYANHEDKDMISKVRAANVKL